MSAADPRVVWDALDAHGCGPHGELHNFRSRCPAHDGDDRTSLHVTLASDGTILIHCFAYDCPVQEIAERLGLRVADLFPSDQRYEARLRNARREDFTGNARMAVNVLAAVERLGLRWRVEIKLDECPCCESPHPELVIDSGSEPFTCCWRGCGVEAMTGALAERVSRRR